MKQHTIQRSMNTYTWLDGVPSNWTVKPLKFVVTCNDKALPDTTDPDFELEYVDISSVDLIEGIQRTESMVFEKAPSRARRKVQSGDTIVSTVRTYLKAIATIKDPPDNLIVSTGFAVLRPGVELDPDFLGYYTKSQGFVDAVVAHSVGVSYPAINASDLIRLPISYPPLPEQHDIARFLDERTALIDGLIERKERLLQLLAEQRSAIITRAVTRGLDPDVQMKDSGVPWLGEVPVHWEVKRLRFLLSDALKYGANEAAEFDNPEWPRFVRITDVCEDGTLRGETFKSLPPEIASPFLLEEGDILLARSGATVGKSFKYEENWGVACFAGYLIRARLGNPIMADFTSYFLRSQSYWEWVSSIFIQATIQNISAEKYADLALPVPPETECRAIVDYLTNTMTHLSGIYQSAEQIIDSLRTYRSALITAAVTGQIDVRDHQLQEEPA